MDQMYSYVDDESKNKSGTSKLRYPVEHGMATNRDDARKGVDWLVVLANGVEIGVDSRTTATENRDELRLTPSKRDSFQSVARGVVETTVSLPSCQQARSTS